MEEPEKLNTWQDDDEGIFKKGDLTLEIKEVIVTTQKTEEDAKEGFDLDGNFFMCLIPPKDKQEERIFKQEKRIFLDNRLEITLTPLENTDENRGLLEDFVNECIANDWLKRFKGVQTKNNIAKAEGNKITIDFLLLKKSGDRYNFLKEIKDNWERQPS